MPRGRLELLASGLLVWLMQGSTDRRVAMIRKRSLPQRQRATRVDVEPSRHCAHRNRHAPQVKKAVGSSIHSEKREKGKHVTGCHLTGCSTWVSPTSHPGLPFLHTSTVHPVAWVQGCGKGGPRRMGNVLKKGVALKKARCGMRVHHRRSFQSHTYQSLLAVRTPETTPL